MCNCSQTHVQLTAKPAAALSAVEIIPVVFGWRCFRELSPSSKSENAETPPKRGGSSRTLFLQQSCWQLWVRLPLPQLHPSPCQMCSALVLHHTLVTPPACSNSCCHQTTLGRERCQVPFLLCQCSPIDGVLVQLPKLPVHGEDVHVVVLLKVAGQQLHAVVTGLQALLILVDLLHLL